MIKNRKHKTPPMDSSKFPEGKEYCLFALDYGTSFEYQCAARLYGCKCYDNGNLIRNFIPVIYVWNNEVGLLDLVEGKFYRNVGTGTFTAGPVDPSRNLFEYHNRWQQTNDHNVSFNDNSHKFSIIKKAFRNNNIGGSDPFGPLQPSGSPNSATYAANERGDWWTPVGQKELYQSGIPASDGSVQKSMELWIRIDNLPTLNNLSMFENHIQTTNLYEI